MNNKNLYLTRPQLVAELDRCLSCKNKPCMKACPVHCDPHDFIAAAKENNGDAAVQAITLHNPMGQTCGLICPDKFCMKACTRAHIDFPINIPRVQATILEKYRTTENARPERLPANGKKIAVIGAGPAGIAASSELSKLGYHVVLFEHYGQIGGALNLIPENRLPHEVIEKDWSYIADSDLIELRLNETVKDPADLLSQGYNGVIIASGEPESIKLGVEGEELSLTHLEYLRYPEKYVTDGNVAVVGGGAVATDCALTAVHNGAENVEMFVRRRVSDMRITNEERKSLLEASVDITSMTRIKKVEKDGDKLTIITSKNRFNQGKLEEIPDTAIPRPNFSLVITAIGSSAERKDDLEKIITAGDCKNGGSTLVEALASGLEAARTLHHNLNPED